MNIEIVLPFEKCSVSSEKFFFVLNANHIESVYANKTKMICLWFWFWKNEKIFESGKFFSFHIVQLMMLQAEAFKPQSFCSYQRSPTMSKNFEILFKADLFFVRLQNACPILSNVLKGHLYKKFIFHGEIHEIYFSRNSNLLKLIPNTQSA